MTTFVLYLCKPKAHYFFLLTKRARQRVFIASVWARVQANPRKRGNVRPFAA